MNQTINYRSSSNYRLSVPSSIGLLYKRWGRVQPTNGSAISYAQSCMAIVAHYKLAEIVGSPTAGANGNVNPFPLPGGYRVSWTGMRVMNHDDSQHHVRGVEPTFPLKPTLNGIQEGRDELFEKALQLLTAGE